MSARPPTCDLHSHSLWSDGTETPTQVVQHALARGLSALALTDHDTLEGLPEARAAAAGSNLRIISGVELSSAADGVEVHVLGYFVDEGEELKRSLAHFCDVRRERARAMLERLAAMGMTLTEEDVFARAKGGTVGGRTSPKRWSPADLWALDEAFSPLPRQQRPRLGSQAGAHAARGGGAGAPCRRCRVIAHPATIGRDSMIADLAGQGLTGLECTHPKHDPQTAERYRAMARELGLVATGGSDCHGRRPGGSVIGYGDVPLSVVDELEEASRSVRGSR